MNVKAILMIAGLGALSATSFARHRDPLECVTACGVAWPQGSIAYNQCASNCFSDRDQQSMESSFESVSARDDDDGYSDCVNACGTAWPQGSIAYNQCASGCFSNGGHHHDSSDCVAACGAAWPQGSIAYNQCASSCF